MKKDLTTTGKQTLTTKDGGTAVHPADRRFEAVLQGKLAQSKRPAGVPRVVIEIDATSSMGEYLPERKLTLAAARAVVCPIFEKLGPGGLAQFVYFRGADECKASKWFSDPEAMARAMTAVEHRGGWTQHNRVLEYVIREAEKHPIHELLLLTDAFERRLPRRPDGDVLEDAIVQAAQLRALGVNITIGYKGSIRSCPLDRAGPEAEQDLAAIAKSNGGTCFLFNPKKAAAAAQRLAEVAAHAVVKVSGDGAGAQRVLEHMQSVPFDMGVAVDDEVPIKRCGESE
jgi:hypothetical protein